MRRRVGTGLKPISLADLHDAFLLVGEDVIRRSTGTVVRQGRSRSKVVLVKGRRSLQYHRVKYALAHGWLPGEVDHKDGDRENTLLANLRPASRQQQAFNRRKADRAENLPRGVYRSGRRYRAMVQQDGKLVHLGMYDDPELAGEVVRTILRKEHGEFYRDH